MSHIQVPVYGPQSGPEIYGQNDEPLHFAPVVADGNQLVEPMDSSYMGQPIPMGQPIAVGQPIPGTGEMEQTIMQPPHLTESAEIVHAPESYIHPETSSGVLGAGDQTETGTEGAEGSSQIEGAPVVDSASTATPGGEDKKKKKKEKVPCMMLTFYAI